MNDIVQLIIKEYTSNSKEKSTGFNFSASILYNSRKQRQDRYEKIDRISQ
jgi:hypothetical protein